jgi:hypothetical protein
MKRKQQVFILIFVWVAFYMSLQIDWFKILGTYAVQQLGSKLTSTEITPVRKDKW